MFVQNTQYYIATRTAAIANGDQERRKKKPKKKQTEICACLWITAAHVGIYFAAAIIAAVFFMYFCSMSSCSNIHQNDEMPRPRCNIIPSPEFCMRSYNDAKSRNS